MNAVELERLGRRLGAQVSCDTPEGSSYLLILADGGEATFVGNFARGPATAALLRALADKIDGKTGLVDGRRWLPPELVRVAAGG